MNIKEIINNTKSEYTLKDFAMFKLCPMMYKCSVLYPEQTPISGEQRRLQYEAGILSDAFSAFTDKVSSQRKIYFKNTSLCLTDIVECISDCIRTKLKSNDDLNEYDIELITNGLYDKAERIVSDIHRWIKGSRYTILGGMQKKYAMNGFTFNYVCSYRSADIDNGGWRSIYIDEYKDFPVFSAGKSNPRIIHYADIMDVLNSDDTSANRVGLALKIIRKINIQIESGYYEQDGLERISALGKEIQAYDFEHPCKKSGEFCNYCKYFDKCRQFL